VFFERGLTDFVARSPVNSTSTLSVVRTNSTSRPGINFAAVRCTKVQYDGTRPALSLSPARPELLHQNRSMHDAAGRM
jgi:hypothetical protein